eukprot:gb/GECG01008134.1/.p1 GENE.gb/GECG01008134.1/~~gb/GECG01008134.1/.p1  ORF type:complete len:212 (+),score=42.12 gb/GECG01008134.1/:1-636(+)
MQQNRVNGSATEANVPNGYQQHRQGESLIPNTGLSSSSATQPRFFVGQGNSGGGTGVPIRDERVPKAASAPMNTQKRLEEYENRLYDALELIEDRLFEAEGDYLQKTQTQGNLCVGFDPNEKINSRRNLDENRIFSQSSITSPVAVENEAGGGGGGLYGQQGFAVADVNDTQSAYEGYSGKRLSARRRGKEGKRMGKRPRRREDEDDEDYA